MYKEHFPANLKNARKATGRTQEEVAQILEIPRTTITNYELGRTEPNIETLGKLIDLYKANANDILGTGKY